MKSEGRIVDRFSRERRGWRHLVFNAADSRRPRGHLVLAEL